MKPFHHRATDVQLRICEEVDYMEFNAQLPARRDSCPEDR